MVNVLFEVRREKGYACKGIRDIALIGKERLITQTKSQ